MDENIYFEFIALVLVIRALLVVNASSSLMPPVQSVATFKNVELTPAGSTCGLEYKDTLCDNRYQNSKLCSNTSATIYCDQTCPYGVVMTGLVRVTEQLSLETMSSCACAKDFGLLLSANSSATNSYYFDQNNEFCKANGINAKKWKPFSLQTVTDKMTPHTSASSTLSNSLLSNLYSGFTFSLWMRQLELNNG